MIKELQDIKKAFKWTFENMGTPHTSDHFNVPANAIEQLDKIIESCKQQTPTLEERVEYIENHLGIN